jgi:hypothetical protein
METAADLKTAKPAENGQAADVGGQSESIEPSPIANPAADPPLDAQTGPGQPALAPSPATHPVEPSQGAIPDSAKISLLDKLTHQAATDPQVTARSGETAVTNEVASSISPQAAPSGTPVATNGERMKSAVKKNEIAGSTLQELPSARQTAPTAEKAAGAGAESKTSQPIVIDFSPDQETSAQWMVADMARGGAAAQTMTANAASAGTAAAPAVSEVERMITREVTMVRQSGAESLAVTLKVDSRTSLFLQLTNHNGQIEASVRCEKGGGGGLDSHWGELRESLARQNVQLLPLQDNSQNPSNMPARTGGDFNDPQQTPQRHAQPQPAAEPEVPSDEAMRAAIDLGKHHHPPRHGWEKWA